MILFEYVIPRMGKRVDNVLLIGNAVVVLEFKVGSQSYDRMAQDQVIDYALDLKNFHAASHHTTIVPILVATHAPEHRAEVSLSEDGVSGVLFANSRNLREVIQQAVGLGAGPAVDSQAWLSSSYRPTPTIIEASQALYRGHSVKEITRSEAGADNLGRTTEALNRIIDQARARNEKAICLVTGVPGAGKTLAGLNLACERRRVDTDDAEHAVFLSGNGPLVKVLQEALARDEVAQARARGEHLTKDEAKRHACAFIQNIHHFRDTYLDTADAPCDRVVVFDEAQRAWDRDQTITFMRRKRNRPDFSQSEPEFLVSVMDRHQTWAAIVCLVGGGQEINTGEAGLEEWLVALRDRYPGWKIYLPEQIDSAEYLPTFDLGALGDRVVRDSSLHLGVSLRSFRSERLSAAVGGLLTGNPDQARLELAVVQPHYPMAITRSLEQAKTWVRDHARGTERIGLLASSGARRLKPLGVYVGGEIDPCHWFLDDAEDVRSSYYLEDAASEFEVQGLEVDWAVVVWDGDLIHAGNGWLYRAFKGSAWQAIHDERAQKYRLNAYRVLLTRARQGLVLVVPEGDLGDGTRPPEIYDPTWEYLLSLGLPEI